MKRIYVEINEHYNASYINLFREEIIKKNKPAFIHGYVDKNGITYAILISGERLISIPIDQITIVYDDYIDPIDR